MFKLHPGSQGFDIEEMAPWIMSRLAWFLAGSITISLNYYGLEVLLGSHRNLPSRHSSAFDDKLEPPRAGAPGGWLTSSPATGRGLQVWLIMSSLPASEIVL